MIEKHSGAKDLQSLKDFVKTMKGGGQTIDAETIGRKPKPRTKTKKETARKEL